MTSATPAWPLRFRASCFAVCSETWGFRYTDRPTASEKSPVAPRTLFTSISSARGNASANPMTITVKVVAKAWRARWPPEETRAWPWRAVQFEKLAMPKGPGRR